jgi:beta-N-acetylhexosaminidase
MVPVILCLFLLVFNVRSYALNFNDEGSPRELAAAIEKAMTDEQALAQVFMLGWVGAEPSPLIMDWIRVRNIGGVKIFGWNTADTRLLALTVGDLQEASLEGPFSIPLLIATDQEGGWIRHVKGSTSETPGNMAIGASGFPRDAYLAGFYIGRELALLGINMNFAPTVDLFTNHSSSLIGPRSFGSDPVKVGILGAAFMKGQLAAGVIPTAKHYPGHGDTSLDSHGVLPKIDLKFEELWERELVPYRMLSLEGLPAIMSGHLAFPETEAASVPASLSSWFLKDVLRDKIGYRGIIVTDDLMMNGATSWAGSLSRTAKQALLAGNDIIMFSKTPLLLDPVWTQLLSSMKDERDFNIHVRNAARRVLELKLTYMRGKNKVPYIPDIDRVSKELPDSQGAAFFLNLAARSVTVVKPEVQGSLFPITRENSGRVLLAARYVDFFKSGRAAFPDALLFSFRDSDAAAEFPSYARNADTIIFCLGDATDLQVLRSIQYLNKKVIVLSVLNPVYLENIPWVSGALAVYSYAPESFAAGFSVITGRIFAQGILPYE